MEVRQLPPVGGAPMVVATRLYDARRRTWHRPAVVAAVVVLMVLLLVAPEVLAVAPLQAAIWPRLEGPEVIPAVVPAVAVASPV